MEFQEFISEENKSKVSTLMFAGWYSEFRTHLGGGCYKFSMHAFQILAQFRFGAVYLWRELISMLGKTKRYFCNVNSKSRWCVQ
jgi:hypothetical protein